jgi:hypothetical protein
MKPRWLEKALARAASPRAAVRAMYSAERLADRATFLLGQLHSARIAQISSASTLAEIEFGVYSQWGEDGIVEYLVSRTEIPNTVFVEFGVEDYTESNTRFLLRHRNWSGLVIDGSERNVRAIRADSIHLTHDLQAVAAFVTAENINSLIAGSGIGGDIGLLSIDVDGNDYWVWRAIDVVSPRVVVCEYNSLFGAEQAVTIPYDPGFVRRRAHHSTLYFGASLRALQHLASEKGYVFVGCNSAGVNAFFVRQDCADAFEVLAANARFVEGKFRESRAPDGRRTFLSGAARQAAIADCLVQDVISGRLLKVGDLPQSRS